MANKPTIFARDATGLTKALTTKDALMLNMANMGIGYAFLYMFYGPALYPGVNMLESVIIALPISLLVSAIYYFLSNAMPRTGGDYVYNSRILHPSLGFMSTLWYVIILTTFVGISAVWVPQLGLAPIMWAVGTASGNSGLVSLSSTIGSANVSALIGSVIVILFTLILILGARASSRFAWIFFGLVIIGFITFISTMLAAGHATFVQRFASISGTTPDKVISAAQSAGYITSFTLTGTLLGIVYSVLNYAGFVQSVYFAAEIKGEVRRNQLYAIFGSLLIFAVMLVIFYGTLYSVIGAPLLHSVDYIAATANPAYTLPVSPTGMAMIVFATGNPYLIALSGMTFVASIIAGNVAYILIASRMIFAWSFDRVAPTRLLTLDSRFNSPYLIVIVIGIVGLISVFVELYTAAFSYLAYSITGYAIIYTLAGLAAAVFAYRRKDIFEKAPSVVRKKIGGVPVITLLGILTVISNIIVGYATLTPAFAGAPINPFYISVVLLISMIGIVLYFISYALNKSKGIDLALVFKEIPPE